MKTFGLRVREFKGLLFPPHISYQRLSEMLGPLFRHARGTRHVTFSPVCSLIKKNVCKQNRFDFLFSISLSLLVNQQQLTQFSGYLSRWQYVKGITIIRPRGFFTTGANATSSNAIIQRFIGNFIKSRLEEFLSASTFHMPMDPRKNIHGQS